MRSLPILVVLALVAGCRTMSPPSPPPAVRGAPGDSLAEGTSSVSFHGALTASVPGDAREIEWLTTRAAYDYRLRQGLEWSGEFGLHAIDGGLHAAGPNAGGQVGEHAGASASTLLRWHALQGRGWSAFLEFGLGLLASDDDFPEGGTKWNGLRQTGVGVQFDLWRALRLTAGVRQQHVSNGKGLVQDNPSWEGQGAYVGLEFDVTPRNAEWLEARAMDVPDAAPWSARIEARGGEYDDDVRGGGAVLALDAQLQGPWFAQLRASGDEVEGESLTEFGFALYARGRRGRIGVAYDRQELDVFHDDEFTLFGEWLANDITTVQSVLGHESRSHSDDRVVAGVLLRLYALDELAIDSGVVARAEPDEFRADAFNVPLGVEYALSDLVLPGLSVFAQKDLHDGQRVVGLRWTFAPTGSAHRSLRERDYSSGPLRLRP